MGELVTVAQAAWLVRRDQRAVRYHIAQQHLAPIVGDDGHMRLDLEAIAAVVGWTIDPARLAELRAEASASPATLAAQLQAAQTALRVERDARRALEHRMTALERVITRAAGITPEGWENLARSDGAVSALEGIAPMEGYPNTSQGPGDPLSASGDVSPSESPKASHGYGLSADARHILSRYGPERPVALADDGRGDALRFKTKTDAARWLLRHGLNSEATPKSWRGWPPDELTPTGALAFALDVWRDARARGDWRVTWRLHPCDDPQCVCQTLLAE